MSAEVVLAPASGAALENAVITAETVKAFAPAPDAVELARRHFTQAGFETGRLSGISFTITAPRSVFESAFGKKAVAAKGAGPIEFPVDRLPAPVRKAVKAVTLSRPLDFGPTGSFSS
jgi:hypothetical protein